MDRTILRLIGKWLRAGVLEEGERKRNVVGVPQGWRHISASGQYLLTLRVDLWITRKIRRELAGRIYLIRYTDDFVISSTDREDARKVWGMLPDRLKRFGLELSPEKSRIIEFGRKAYLDGKENGNRLSTFDFFGFTHYMTRSRKGGARLGRKTIGKRYRRTLIALNDKLRKLRAICSHFGSSTFLCRFLKGYYNYYGFAGNAGTLSKFAYAVGRMWYKWLNRRSQRKSFNWEELRERLKRFPLPRPKIAKGYSWIYAVDM